MLLRAYLNLLHLKQIKILLLELIINSRITKVEAQCRIKLKFVPMGNGSQISYRSCCVSREKCPKRGLWLDEFYAKSYLKDEISLSYESHLEISTIHN